MKSFEFTRTKRTLLFTLSATVVFFVVFSLLFYFVNIWVLTHSSFRFSRIARGDIHVDVLVVGNSRGVNLITGRGSDNPPTVFNLSYNGLGRAATFSWVKTFFHQGNTARIIVVEATTLFEDAPGCDSKPYWAVYPDLYEAASKNCWDDDATAKYFPLTMFNSEQYMRALYYLIVRPRGDQDWADDYDIPDGLCARLPVDRVELFRDKARQVDVAAIRREIAELKQELSRSGYKGKLVFVLAPFFTNNRSMPAIAEIERVDATILGPGNSLSLATALGANCSDFADALHVGRNGRPKILLMLLKHMGMSPS